jgi:hypothetical protein
MTEPLGIKIVYASTLEVVLKYIACPHPSQPFSSVEIRLAAATAYLRDIHIPAIFETIDKRNNRGTL